MAEERVPCQSSGGAIRELRIDNEESRIVRTCELRISKAGLADKKWQEGRCRHAA